MGSDPVRKRIWVTAALLLAGVIALHAMSHGERIPLHKVLRDFPLMLGEWQGYSSPFPEDIVKAVGVTDYLNRVYIDGHGDALEFYVGYYASQRTGDTIHSPKHCLPGGGWTPLTSTILKINLDPEKTIAVNNYVIGRGLQREVVLYWYQSQGRVIASEYWARCWLIVDAITRDQTDGALVRVIAPVGGGISQARTLAVGFVKDAFPKLKGFLPD